MPTDAVFRFSTYLTLALACACVGYAEFELLPEVAFISGAVIVSLAVLFRLESRVELLTIPDANRLGLGIGLANFAWAAFRFTSEMNRPELVHVDWQLMLVALFGPLLITLIPAKLARREKHAGDYWGLHIMGLGAVGLAGAMTEDPVSFVLIGLYAAAGVWSLMLFYLGRATGKIPPVPGREPSAQFHGVVTRSRGRVALGSGMAVAAVAAACAIPGYLVTPRSPADKLEFGKPRIEIGYAADQMIDLTQTGNLRTNERVAFELTAETEHGPKTDLNPDQRWRGRTMRKYSGGTWEAGEGRLPGIEPTARQVDVWSQPKLGEGQISLTFTVPRSLRTRLLADPVAWKADEPPPLATITPDGLKPWLPDFDGSFVWSQRPASDDESFRYVQVWRRATPDEDLSPPFQLTDPPNAFELITQLLRNNPVPKVKVYADGLVDSLIASGLLPPDCRDRVSLLPRPEFRDAVARAFTSHLATTPDLTYTTNLRREKKDIDPIEEFLFHTKVGHCERFATALALMLRSQGIPCVLVLGFKGCEPGDEPGHYRVRHEHAHAWVEALLPVIDPPAGPGQRRTFAWHWRSLDPTPSGTAAADAGAKTWAGKAKSWFNTVFDDYVSRYTPERRKKAIAAAAGFFTRWDVLAGVAGLVIVAFMVRIIVRRRRTAGDANLAGRFGRLVAVLTPYGFRFGPGETPREFAAGVWEALKNDPGTRDVAEVPLEWIESYYEIRFGGTPLNPERAAALDDRLDALSRALANR